MAKMIQRPIYCSACKEVHDLNLAEEPYRRLINKWNNYNYDDCVKEVAGEIPEHEVRLILLGKCS